ncbi:FxsA family protein [Pelagibacterium lacus]|uniref:FxsA family protein n=1 Tax=Pelagibacterium lacus TaxID=2282655 RepID=A0A369W2D8_9HYPH|nr:FxsA family protein [Pelagibacterium lacus]RDE08533.1 FxsA family protein [Pelagibacterium lacus]
MRSKREVFAPVGRFLLLGLLALPFVEIAGFIWVGSQIGILATLALIVLTAVLGVAIVRQQGLGMVLDSRAMMARGEVPQQKIAEMMMVAVAGFLLLLPGFLTDLVGLVLLVPPVRGWIYRRLSANMVIVTSYRPASRGPAYTSIDLDPDDYRS